MRSSVRLALSNAVEGRSGLEFERGCERYCLAGTEMGQKQHPRHFARQVEFIGSRILQEMDACSMTAILQGLGIPSDFGRVMDPVTIGGAGFSRHEAVNVIVMSLVSPATYRIVPWMMEA